MPLIITKTKPKPPACMIVYGLPGVGKTTLAASIPDSVFLPVEDGTGRLEVDALPRPSTFTEIIDTVRALTTETHPYRVLVIDTIDAAEALLFAEMVRRANVDTIEEVGGGFSKGYTQAVEAWQALCVAIDTLHARRGVVTVLLAHCVVAPYRNPEGPDYDRYTLKIHAKSAQYLIGFAQVVLFAGYSDTVMLNKADSKRRDANLKRGKVVEGERALRSKRCPAYDAKTRYQMPDEIPMSAAALGRYIPGLGGVQRTDDWIAGYTEDLRARLTGLGVDVGDPLAALRAAFSASGRDFDKLSHTGRMQTLDKLTEGSALLTAILQHATPTDDATATPSPEVTND